MTEAQWLACNDPRPLLRSINRRWRAASRRGETVNFERFRLFACACARRLWDLLSDTDRQAVELLEDYARNGRGSLRDIRRLYSQGYFPAQLPTASLSACLTAWAGNLAASVIHEASARAPTRAATSHLSAARAAGSFERAQSVAGTSQDRFISTDQIDGRLSETELAAQAALGRDILGNPFRPTVIDPAWLAWNSGTIPNLAQQVYDAAAFDCLPILADALEEAGCTDETILTHLREPGPHARGCRVLDLLLGNE